MVIGLSNGNFNYSISFSKSTLLLVLGNSFSLYYCLLNTIKFVHTLCIMQQFNVLLVLLNYNSKYTSCLSFFKNAKCK